MVMHATSRKVETAPRENRHGSILSIGRADGQDGIAFALVEEHGHVAYLGEIQGSRSDAFDAIRPFSRCLIGSRITDRPSAAIVTYIDERDVALLDAYMNIGYTPTHAGRLILTATAALGVL